MRFASRAATAPQRRLTALALLAAPVAVLVHLVHTVPARTECLPARGWVSRLGVQLALLQPDPGCSSGTWAMTASGAVVLFAALGVLLAVTLDRGWTAGVLLSRLIDVLLHLARLVVVTWPRLATAAPAESMRGRHPSGYCALRGPPTA
ncbi:MAG: hypothetical protein U0Q19_19760 [Kineosporiaceae bacterium]